MACRDVASVSARPYSVENRRKMIQLGVVQAVKDLAADGADGDASGSAGAGGREAGTPATKKEPKVGLADIVCHVIDRHFEPWFLEFNGMLCRGGVYLPYPLPATSSTHICNHYFLS